MDIITTSVGLLAMLVYTYSAYYIFREDALEKLPEKGFRKDFVESLFLASTLAFLISEDVKQGKFDLKL